MSKMDTNQVYRVIESYAQPDGMEYAKKSIPEIAAKTGWAESSIALAIELNLWLPNVDDDLYALEEADASDFEVYASAGLPDKDMSEDVWDRFERVNISDELSFEDDEPRNRFAKGGALNRFE